MGKFISRKIDYLGDLGAKLRDLQGHRTLVNELIQNADDAGATTMAFDVRDDVLVVDNDALFSDCGTVEAEDCKWSGAGGHRCDFHRFRVIAAGDKRNQQGTTGAFGIGFISVYQITDRPELISAGRHWLIDEQRSEDERIQVCDGCSQCSGSKLPATRFILPWALDPTSVLRKAFRAEPVTETTPRVFVEELIQCLPVAMLFLKKVKKVTILRGGVAQRVIQRKQDGTRLTVSDDHGERSGWHLIRGNFDAAGAALKATHAGRIEEKRSYEVRVAIPDAEPVAGLLCASLPTEHRIGLPFHVNGDFFPSNDRKHILLGNDFQSDWNRAALTAAAEAVGSSLSNLPELLGAQGFWRLVSEIKEASDRDTSAEHQQVLNGFWSEVERRLDEFPTVQTTSGEWVRPSECTFLFNKVETDAIPILESLEIAVAHEDLRPYQNILRSSGVEPLTIRHIAQAFDDLGLNEVTKEDALPDGLKSQESRVALWTEIRFLRDRAKATPKVLEEDDHRLRRLAIAPECDGGLWPPSDLYAADETTRKLFTAILPDLPFLEGTGAFGELSELSDQFNAEAAISELEQLSEEDLEAAWREGRLNPAEVLNWFEDRRTEVLDDEGLSDRLADLPLFPSKSGLHPLADLTLPGEFIDTLNLADLVDLEALNGRREFLRDLGMKELDFRTYAVERLPQAFDSDDIDARTRRAAVALLASKIGELADDRDALDILRSTPLVECLDGVFRRGDECYFRTKNVAECLGSSANIALPPPEEHRASINTLYASLGVASEPRDADVVEAVEAIVEDPPSSDSRGRVHRILALLVRKVASDDELPDDLEALTDLEWLPAKGDAENWYAPHELFASYQDYLFKTQAEFIDCPAQLERACGDLFEQLGLNIVPTASLVVKHLLQCAANNEPVNKQVYAFLNQNADDRSLELLVGKECLLIGDVYRSPSEVYWSDHPFGSYRLRLGEDLRIYGDFLRRVGVIEHPTPEDAFSVIQEIAATTNNSLLDDDARAVLWRCWEMVDRALRSDVIEAEVVLATLSKVKCVPNRSGILYTPDLIFFDSRAGLAAKFGTFLRDHVITRPVGSGLALTAAGVEELGKAVNVEVLERREATPDLEMRELLDDRRDQIGRVFVAQGADVDVTGGLARLADLACERTTLLKIQYELSVFGRTQTSNPEFVPALYLHDEHTLCHATGHDGIHWAAIARELAIAAFPDEDPGRFSSALKEVLSCRTADEAAAILDELGLADVDASDSEESTVGGVAAGLGTDDEVESYEDEGEWESDADGLDDEFPAANEGEEEEEEEEEEEAGEEDEAEDDVAGDDTADDASHSSRGRNGGHSGAGDYYDDDQGEEELGGEEAEIGRTDGGHGRSGGGYAGAGYQGGAPSARQGGGTNHRSPGGSQGVRQSSGSRPFISYVATSHEDEEEDPDGLSHQQRLDLEELAIQHILSLEPQLQRTPTNNPGFDLTEQDADGDTVRWIEVKAMTGSLQDRPATMSHTQFECAQACVDAYWLYVVEHAGAAPKIVKIQDPAGQARTFLFDRGWLAIAQVED